MDKKNDNPYSKYMAETNLGLMFNVTTPWNSSYGKIKPGHCKWIRAEDIIGVESHGDEYYLRVKYLVGRGINYTDSLTQVAKEAFEMVCWYFNIP